MGGTGDGSDDRVQVSEAGGRKGPEPFEPGQADVARQDGGGEDGPARAAVSASTGQEASKPYLTLYNPSDLEREDSKQGEAAPWRRPVGVDYGRIIHSASFRRLQGKTQVFPVDESDFFRNRLTHSLEVAQIAEGIADRLNFDLVNKFRGDLIDARLCAAAALIHDLGHPPFGHNGERALDRVMRKYGGFEGNAQSLRIVSRLEKKVLREASDTEVGDEEDNRLGLNLTFRLLAAILKYDKCIPQVRKKSDKICKGYYASEKALVKAIKQKVCPDLPKTTKFKSIECQIMDLADDIAYSTYDLEDCLKAGFLTPAIIFASDQEILDRVAEKVSKELDRDFRAKEVLPVFEDIFSALFTDSKDSTMAGDAGGKDRGVGALGVISEFNEASNDLSQSSFYRTGLSGDLVGFAIKNVELDINDKYPALSKVKLSKEAAIRVEVLKQYTFITTVNSPRVKVAEFRGYALVKDIFKALDSARGGLLMPNDVRQLYEITKDEAKRKRIICDFVAGMTDRYAIEFYARLNSDTAQSIFKPL